MRHCWRMFCSNFLLYSQTHSESQTITITITIRGEENLTIMQVFGLEPTFANSLPVPNCLSFCSLATSNYLSILSFCLSAALSIRFRWLRCHSMQQNEENSPSHATKRTHLYVHFKKLCDGIVFIYKLFINAVCK